MPVQKRKYVRRRRYNQTKTKGFAKKVLSVVNRSAEHKRFTSQLQNSVTSSLTTWNLLSGCVKGTNSSQRIGSKIHLGSLRLAMQFYSTTGLGAAINNALRWRVIVFRGKYDYTLTNYPAAEVFELNAGSSPNSNITAPIDTNQVTILLDKVFSMQTPVSGAEAVRTMVQYLKINKTFNFKDDDEFGKTSNLYLGVVQENLGLTNALVTGHVTATYTDI